MPVVFTLARTYTRQFSQRNNSSGVKTTTPTTTNRTEIFIFIVCILLSRFLCVGALVCWILVFLASSFIFIFILCFITSFHSLIIIVYRYERCSEAYVIRLDMTCLQRNDAQVLLLCFACHCHALALTLCLFFPPGSWFLFALFASDFLLLFMLSLPIVSYRIVSLLFSQVHTALICTHTIFRRRQLVYFDLNCIDAQIISYLQYIF